MTPHQHPSLEERTAARDRRIEAFYVAEGRMRLVRRTARIAAGASRPR